ncbi:methyltransferase domain-containing protein [Shewanella cyperi]|uniref:Methyltransferase domain-containing protein n=1 Tax=Shewanella cyperi TaxID=2814292 RepID=A0A974XKN7_9GAMM|nr:methyltransferase domain-containing protein [Shewanella cyperi]QSX30187.1 methyltransferase domain-containing protein [Shewanella cyperi]QSX40959.1 methyltransferase domain-containing protein [Shewanella cyperi]
MQACPLCHHREAAFFHQDKKRSYFRCPRCELVFADVGSHLPPEAIRRRYGREPGGIKQKQLSQFLLPLLGELSKTTDARLQGLNYGRLLDASSLAIIEAAGHSLNQFDVYLAPRHDLLRCQYDFVSCFRVFEHFINPGREWELLVRLLKPGAFLAINTRLLQREDNFAKWHHKNNLAHVSFCSRATFEYLAAASGLGLLFAGNDLILMQKASGSDITRDLVSHLAD